MFKFSQFCLEYLFVVYGFRSILLNFAHNVCFPREKSGVVFPFFCSTRFANCIFFAVAGVRTAIQKIWVP